MTHNNRTMALVVSSIIAALIFVFTYLIRIPIPVLQQGGAYVNIGDCVIYCAGMLVGAPWAAAAAGIGSALADLAAAVPIYMPATLIIKGLMGFLCATLMKDAKLLRFVLVSVLGGAVMVAGYGVYELFVFGWPYAVTSLPFNAVQWIAGVVGALALYYPVKRIKGVM